MRTVTVAATLDSLAQISAFIADATAQTGLDAHAAWQVELAVDEAATNIIQHGYDPSAPGTIALAWRVEDDAFVVILRDTGRRFNPDDIPAPDITSPLDERQAGGLGLYIMKQLMDSVRFDFDDQHGNVLTMSKRIATAPAGVHIVDLGGRLDAVGARDAIERIDRVIVAGARRVLLDLARVSFLSSSGLRALLLVRKDLLAQGGELRLCALQPQVEEVFKLTGFTQVFTIHDTREKALAAFGQEQR